MTRRLEWGRIPEAALGLLLGTLLWSTAVFLVAGFAGFLLGGGEQFARGLLASPVWAGLIGLAGLAITLYTAPIFSGAGRPSARSLSPAAWWNLDWITLDLWYGSISVFLFIYLPMAVMVIFSFHTSKIVNFPFKPFTWDWYLMIPGDKPLVEAVFASLKLAGITVVLSLGIGLPGAFVLDRVNFPGKVLYQRFVLLPLILPGIITGVSLLSFFKTIGIKLTAGYPTIPGWPLVIGHGTALVSIVVTQVFARLQRFDRAQEEASADLGANEWKTFWYVTLPNIRTAVLGAALLVFTLSMDEIAVSFFLIGRRNTIPLEIFGRMRRTLTPEILAISTLIFLTSIVIILVWARLMREERAQT